MIPYAALGRPLYRVLLGDAAKNPVLGLAAGDANLRVVWISDHSATSTVAGGADLEAVATVGMYVPPSLDSRVRFRQVDAANMPGLYELHLPLAAHTDEHGLPHMGSIQAHVWDASATPRIAPMYTSLGVLSPSDLRTIRSNPMGVETLDGALMEYMMFGFRVQNSPGTATLLGRVVGTLAAGTHAPQTGDSFARLGAAGAGLTALGDARLANLDAAVSSRAAPGAAMALATAALTAVRAEMEAVVATATREELLAAPPANAPLAAKIGWMFMLARNRQAQTANAATLFRDDGTTVAGTSPTANDGTTTTIGRWQ